MADELHQLSEDGGLARLTLNRPPANALNLEFVEQLADVFEALALDARVRALVITGSGSCFCAGLDLKELSGYTMEQQDAMIRGFNRLSLALYGFPRPTVAAVNGHAVAGGMILALCCDVRIGAGGGSRFGLTEGQVGVAFPMGALASAVGELGPAAARRLLLGAGVYGPEEAVADGFLDRLTTPEAVVDLAEQEARERMTLPPSYGEIKRQLRRKGLDRIEEALRHGDPLQGRWLDAGVPARIEAILENLG